MHLWILLRKYRHPLLLLPLAQGGQVTELEDAFVLSVKKGVGQICLILFSDMAKQLVSSVKNNDWLLAQSKIYRILVRTFSSYRSKETAS
jgi:hypothetical protein